MARVPFAPLDNPRLQHLASAKNRQNGLSAQKPTSTGKANIAPPKPAQKRAFEPVTFDEYDSENVDPTVFLSPSKKSKNDGSAKPFTFSLTPTKSMLPPPTIPPRLSTPTRANMASSRAPMTAPAGRSPKRKAFGITKNRRVSAPFTRIDPPFASRTSSLPFSLDAALSGTFSTPALAKSAGATIEESMPKSWFFDIYEDTPEEEASNLMEHSTLTLDLSSDDESTKKAKDDRGKENTPPEGYDAPAASRPVDDLAVGAPRYIKKTEMVRKKVFVDEMDDGERSPLSDLETEPFFPEGLDKDSHLVIDGTPEKPVTKAPKLDVSNLFAVTSTFPFGGEKAKAPTSPTSMPVVDREGGVKGEIIIWEDNSVPQDAVGQSEDAVSGTSTKVVEVYDENTVPAVVA